MTLTARRLVDEARRRGVKPSAVLAEQRLISEIPTSQLVLHPDWTPPPPPIWATRIRPQQTHAVQAIMDAYADGAKVVLLDGPPGSGKTLIADMVIRQLRARSALYICTTRTLQDQVTADFPHARVLKGRANYQTLTGNVDSWGRPAGALSLTNEITCADCTARTPDDNCRWCNPTWQCPYRQAKQQAISANFAVLNTAYALVDWNLGSRSFSGRELVVVDECDLMEDELVGHVELHIPRGLMRQLRLLPPEKRTVEATWLPWVTNQAIPKVARAINSLPPRRQAPPKELRDRRRLEELLARLHLLERELPQGGWVYDGYTEGDVRFRPVYSAPWGSRLLWPHGQRWLLMSGSIVSAESLVAELGLEADWRLVSLPSTFPAHHRPVYALPAANMTRKNQEDAWPKMVDAVLAVLGRHPGERVLVHTVSYDLARHLMKTIPRRARANGQRGRRFYTYSRASERGAALAAYKLHDAAVLFAPSLDRGVDLPGDLCRVQVVTKVPWPNLGDKRVAARTYSQGGQAWYAVAAVRTLMQMTGRGIRSEDDQAITYVLDAQFSKSLWRKHRRLFPSWWRDGLDSRRPLRWLTKPLNKGT